MIKRSELPACTVLMVVCLTSVATLMPAAAPRFNGTLFIIDGPGTVTVVAPVSDADGDGLSDAWELAQGLNFQDASDAGVDFDGDGLTSLQEYARGTDPWNVDTDGDLISDAGVASPGSDSPLSGSKDVANVSRLHIFQPTG